MENYIDDEGVMALTECVPELFPSLDDFDVGYEGNELLKVLIDNLFMYNDLCVAFILQALRESRKTAVLNEWARTRLPPQNEKVSKNSDLRM